MSDWHSTTITDRTKNLYTFIYVPRFEDQEQRVDNPRLAWHQQPVVDNPGKDLTSKVGEIAAAVWRPGMAPQEFARQAATRMGYRRYLTQTFNDVPLEDISGPINLANGVAPKGRDLAIILDAIRLHDISLATPRRTSTLELSDLKSVISKLGSMIGQLDSLPADKRRHAESALYNAISEQCANMKEPS